MSPILQQGAKDVSLWLFRSCCVVFCVLNMVQEFRSGERHSVNGFGQTVPPRPNNGDGGVLQYMQWYGVFGWGESEK